MNQKGSTIQQKIMRLVLITSGVAVFLSCFAFVTYQYFAFREKAISQLSILGEMVASNSTAALAFEDHQAATETLGSLRAEKNIVTAILYDTAGLVFATYPPAVPKDSLPSVPDKPGYHYAGTRLEGFQPVIQGTIQVGNLYIRSDQRELYQFIIRYAMIGLLFFGSAIVVAYILSARLQKKISTPILALSKTAARITETQNYSVRANHFDNDELGLLTTSFNTMLGHIEEQNDQITAFAQSLERKVAERTDELETANRQLILQTEFVQAIIDSSVDIIAVFDTELNYLVLNQHGRKLYGLESQAFLGRNISAVFPEIIHAQMYQDLKEAVKGTAVHNPYYSSQLSNIIFENFYVPLTNKDNQVHSVLVIGHDITAIVQSSEQLKKINLSLEHSNRDLEQFAYVASHDLQEPLRKIQIFSGQIYNHAEDAESSKRYSEKINASALRLSNLIKGVLNYSRLNHDVTLFEPVPLARVITEILSDFELMIAEKRAVVTLEPVPVVPGIPLQLNQLFSNLLSNALKFSQDRPAIQISSSVVAGSDIENFPDVSPQNNYVLVSIADNGIGFEQQFAPSVFNIFQRLHKKEVYSGTGIGLALCKKIVDNHFGHICVQSVPGKGSTFFIYLPSGESAVQL